MDRRALGLVVAGVLAVIGTLDSVLSLIDRLQAGINFGELFAIARIPAGPLALVLVLYLWRRPSGNPYRVIRPEWESSNQTEHWQGVRSMAFQAKTELRTATGKDVTVGDQNSLKNLVDSLDLQVSGYSELWAVGSWWDERDRVRWESDRLGSDYPPPGAPPWARPLWDRISYASWWLSRHDPLSWEGDAGSSGTW